MIQVELGLNSAIEQNLISFDRVLDQSAKACLSKFFDNKQLKQILQPIQVVFDADLTQSD